MGCCATEGTHTENGGVVFREEKKLIAKSVMNKERQQESARVNIQTEVTITKDSEQEPVKDSPRTEEFLFKNEK